MGLGELVGGEVGRVATQPLAHAGLAEARSDPRPPTGVDHVPAEPRGEAPEPILVVAAPGDGDGPVGARDGEGEDDEREEEGDERRHGEEVRGEEALAAPVGADEAGEGDEEDEGAEDDEGPPREAQALGVGLRGEPDPGADDGD